LFTIGLLRALEAEGADLSNLRLRRFPEGLAERVAERLKGLDAPARSTLEVLATLGRRAEFGELVAASGASTRVKGRDGATSLQSTCLDEMCGRDLQIPRSHDVTVSLGASEAGRTDGRTQSDSRGATGGPTGETVTLRS
jgi:hypothetical protein